MQYKLLICGLLFTGITSCKKLSELDVDNRCSIITGGSTVLQSTDSTCLIKVRYIVSSALNPTQLLAANYFTFDTLGRAFSLNDTAIYLTTKETQRIQTPANAHPFSLLFLMDKTIASITTSFNVDHLLPFETNFYNTFSKLTNYEISTAAYGRDNPSVPDSFAITSGGFKNNVKDIGLDKWSYLFDVSVNQGEPDVFYALDTAMQFLGKNAKYNDKVLFLFTDDKSVITDATQLNTLSTMAQQYHISVYIFSTLYPDISVYSQLALCSRTNGFYFSTLSSDVLLDQFDIVFPGLYNAMSGGSVYESTFQMKASAAFFNRISWAIPFIEFKFYTNEESDQLILFEH